MKSWNGGEIAKSNPTPLLFYCTEDSFSFIWIEDGYTTWHNTGWDKCNKYLLQLQTSELQIRKDKKLSYLGRMLIRIDQEPSPGLSRNVSIGVEKVVIKIPHGSQSHSKYMRWPGTMR